MQITVIGYGRIGVPLVQAARQAGHIVTALGRSATGDVFQALPPHIIHRFDGGDCPSSTDLLILAAPLTLVGCPDRASHEVEFGWVNRLPSRVAVASVVGGLPLASVRSMFPGRPVTRFMCSPAVVDPTSIRYFDADGEESAARLLRDAFPSPSWRGIESMAFDVTTQTFCAAAVVCAAIAEFEEHLRADGTMYDAVFMVDTVQEALRLIRLSGGDSARAFAGTATPGGRCREIYQRLFKRPYCDPAGEMTVTQPRIES